MPGYTEPMGRLVQDPRKRATADEIFQHQWMKEHGTASNAPLDNVILRRMQGFSAMNKLKQQALYILAKNMAPAEVAGLRAIFLVLPCGMRANMPACTVPCSMLQLVNGCSSIKRESYRRWTRIRVAPSQSTSCGRGCGSRAATSAKRSWTHW